ncbi:Ig-like domain-containing protein, partial [Candidatus Pelagibacter sp.]|nr:Ig-like domain-containing protein [Candidatus Pelagibacter sp.]
MNSFLIRTIFFFFILSWNNVSNSVEVLGTGAGALMGGDLTDPEDDGVDGADTNWNWSSISASSEPKWTAEGSYNVFDNKVGSSNNKWCCNGPTQWIAVEFSQAYTLNSFTITSGNDVVNRDPDQWKIQGSNDGNNWTDIFTYSNDGTPPWSDRNQVLLYSGGGDDFATPSAYLHFRYHVTSVKSGSLHQINELEFFGTPDSTDPTLTSSVPADNATGVALDANIVLNFDEFVDAETGNITIKKTLDNSIVETINVTNGQVSGSGTAQITINPSANLDDSTEYYVLIDATGFDDLSGNSYVGISSTTALSFTTVDTTVPSLTSSVPADNATGIAADANIILNFS